MPPSQVNLNACPERGPLWVAPMPVHGDGSRKIQCVMIANRGEIACRIVRTCRKLQIRTVAIYTEEYVKYPIVYVIPATNTISLCHRDTTSRHMSDADEAVNLGSFDQSGGNPYLDVSLLVDVAKGAGVDAVHPGYGHMSENAEFADAIREAGIIFIGPTSDAMSTLGDKRQAKEYLSQHEPSVPLIPGFTGSSKGVEVNDLKEHAARIGYPVMIKASAGGGGRGLRILRDPSRLESEFERARSESQRSFGIADYVLETTSRQASTLKSRLWATSMTKLSRYGNATVPYSADIKKSLGRAHMLG